MQPTKVFFRNDDVNTLDDELRQLMDIVLEEGACIDMAVEPANVKQEAVDWLLSMRRADRARLSIITHGYDHVDRIPGKGEFGGRTYEDQLQDIRAGRELMDRYFAEHFFPAFTCPRGGHNQATIRCMDEMGYRVFSSYHNVYFKNALLYSAGRALRRTHLFGKRVSYHTRRIPNTRLMDISMSMSLIRRYHSDDECEFPTLNYLRERLAAIRATGQNIIGVTVHHRYHKKPEDMRFIRDAVRMFREEGCEFSTIERLHNELTRNVQ